MFDKNRWLEKKKNNSALCEDITRYCELQLMKWVTPGMEFTQHQKKLIRKTNEILINEKVITAPFRSEDLVQLLQAK